MALKTLNTIRRSIMPVITSKIGKNHLKKINRKDKIEIRKILICRPNQRLGNILLLTPLIQEVVSLFPDAKIEIIVKGKVALPILKEYQNIEDIIVLPRKPFKQLWTYTKTFLSVVVKKYDITINGEKGSSSGKILTYLSNSTYKVYGNIETQEDNDTLKDFEHMAKNCVYNFRNYLKLIGFKPKVDAIPLPNIKLTNDEIKHGKKLLERHFPNTNKPCIAIFTNATGSKKYSKHWWRKFHEKIQKQLGTVFNILEVLPIENTSQLDFRIQNYYSKDLREIASLLYNTECFIGADSGMMHLSVASQTLTIGLFNVTNIEKYAPYGRRNTFINTNQGSIEDHIELIAKTICNASRIQN